MVKDYYDPPTYERNPNTFMAYISTEGVRNHFNAFELRTRAQLANDQLAQKCISKSGTGNLYVESNKLMYYKPVITNVGAEPLVVEALQNAEQYHRLRNEEMPASGQHLINMLPDVVSGHGTFEGLRRRREAGIDT